LFIGTVRNISRGKEVIRLEYEAYEGMSVSMLRQFCEEAQNEFNLLKTAVIHRTGSLEVGEVALAIAVSAEHRSQGFSGCRFLLEKIKKSLPVWKKEIYTDGEAWIEDAVVKEEKYE
jgi:molybdopterin synthase catalytic subunit